MATKTLQTATGSRSVLLMALELALGEFKNPRTFTGLETDDIRALAQSIWDEGLRTPLIVQRIEDDQEIVHEVVEDGQRRVRALRYLAEVGKITSDFDVPVNDSGAVKKASTETYTQAIEDALTIGVQRAGLSTYELVEAAADLLARGRKQAQIAARIGRSDTWVSRMLKAWKASTPELRESLRTGKVTDEQFKELATVKPAEQPEAVAEIVEVRERGERAAAREASRQKAIENTPTPKARKSPLTDKEERALERDAKYNPQKILTSQRTGAAGKRVEEAPPSKVAKTVRGLPDIVDLANKFPSKHGISSSDGAYVAGCVDMAKAITSGDLEGFKFRLAWKAWLADAVKRMQKADKPAAPAKTAQRKRGPSAAAAEKQERWLERARAKPAAKPSGASSKACSARHHDRCKDMMKRGLVASCGCDCHTKGK